MKLYGRNVFLWTGMALRDLRLLEGRNAFLNECVPIDVDARCDVRQERGVCTREEIKFIYKLVEILKFSRMIEPRKHDSGPWRNVVSFTLYLYQV